MQRYTVSDTHNPLGHSIEFSSLHSSSSFSFSTKSPMKKHDWVTAALSNDTIVADFLIRMKQQHTSLLPPVTWGYRKSRSKPPLDGVTKGQESGSPTTPLFWNSDGYEDLSSVKDALGNEGATTSSYNKSKKRKSFAELKEEEDFLIKERRHLNRELESMRVTMSNQIATSHNLKKLKIGMHLNPKKEMEKKSKTINHQVQTSCVMQLESKADETGFFLPDLNMVPDEEEIYGI